MSNQAVLECRGLTKSYSEGPAEVHVLQGVELLLKPGERVAIIGSSGSGKTTVLNMLGGLDTPSTGSVWLAVRSCRLYPKRIVVCCVIARWVLSISFTTCWLSLTL